MLIENIIMRKVKQNSVSAGTHTDRAYAHTNNKTHISYTHPRDQLIGFSTISRRAIICAVTSTSRYPMREYASHHGQGNSPDRKARGSLSPVDSAKKILCGSSRSLINDLFPSSLRYQGYVPETADSSGQKCQVHLKSISARTAKMR
jgi:hypothetical protein